VESDFRLEWFRRWWALLSLVLLGVSWRLWVDQAVFPQVPLVQWATAAPGWIDAMLLAVTVGCLALLAFSPRSISHRQLVNGSLVYGSLVAAQLGLVLLNQHRLQAWSYQLMIVAVILASTQGSRSVRLLRLLVISIYFFSAISKFDVLFVESLAVTFLSTLTQLVGLHLDMSAGWVRVAGWLIPTSELFIAAGLLFPRSRVIAATASIGMHVFLLVVLGPLGLSHQMGVWAWNLLFIGQAFLLFLPLPTKWLKGVPSEADERSNEVGTSSARSKPRSTIQLGTIVLSLVVTLPLLEPFGFCDHWMAWGLYAPRNSDAVVYVHQSDLGKLPDEIARFGVTNEIEPSWVQLKIDQWSLESLGVPIYPSDRFQIGVAKALERDYDLDRAIRVNRRSTSHRATGVRQQNWLNGKLDLDAVGDQFRLNISPRQ